MLERVDPGWDAGQGLAVTVPMGLPGKLVGGVLGGGVVALPGHNHGPIRLADRKRLVTVGVAGCGHEHDPWQHLRNGGRDVTGKN